LASSLPAAARTRPAHRLHTGPADPGPPECRLIMGTRSGDIDPAIVLHLMSSLGMTAK
jgi:hypothetical protein